MLSAKAGGSGYDPGVSFSEYRAGGGGGEQGLMAMGTNKKSGSNGSAGIVIIRYPQ